MLTSINDAQKGIKYLKEAKYTSPMQVRAFIRVKGKCRQCSLHQPPVDNVCITRPHKGVPNDLSRRGYGWDVQRKWRKLHGHYLNPFYLHKTALLKFLRHHSPLTSGLSRATLSNSPSTTPSRNWQAIGACARSHVNVDKIIQLLELW